jgi:PAS domain S-box-containing protein
MKFGNLTREKLALELGEAHKLILELKNQVLALKKLIESMRIDKEKYQLLFSLTNDVLFSYDVNLKVLSVSDNAERLIGYKPEEMVGKYFYDLAILHPEDLSDALEDSLSALTGKVITYNIHRFITKDGMIKFGELSRIPLKRSGKTAELICVARDISDRIEREKIISESQETARVLLDASNDTSLILDTSGNVIAINEPAAKRFGKTVKELIGANVFKEMPEMTVAQAKEAIHEVIATGKPLELVAVPAGRPLAISLYPIRDAQGKVARIAANARDFTGNRENPSRSK